MIVGMRQPVPALQMSAGQREVLESLARSQSAAHRQVVRAKALLMAADGVANAGIAASLSVCTGDGSGVGGPGSPRRAWRSWGRSARVGAANRRSRSPKIDEIVHLTQNSTPKGETHWSCRTMAATAGVSTSTVQRVWHARGLKPHLVETFKLSNDPRFEEKLIDVVGLYMNPPEKAIVLCMDEKSSVQALDRTQPSLPMVKGRARDDDPRLQAQRHHHVVRGTGRADRHSDRAMPAAAPPSGVSEVPRTIDREVPEDLTMHLICDNYATHKHQTSRAWLDKHPRFHLHFTPTSSSWLNLVERWFRELTDKALRRGVFHSVPDLIASIEDYLAAHNDDPTPFVWTATAEYILAKVARGRVALQSSQLNDETHHQ